MDRFPSLASWGLSGGFLIEICITKLPGSPNEALKEVPQNQWKEIGSWKNYLTWKKLALKNCVKKKVYENPKAIS